MLFAMGAVPMTSSSRWRNPGAVAAIVGLLVLLLGMVIVRDGTVPGAEQAVFRAVNGLPGWLYPLLWPFQQLGALAAGAVVAVVALVLGRRRLALAALAVTVLKLLAERLVKAAVSRQRPGTSIGADVELRGDVHATGEAFVSGHAVLVAALAGVVTPYLPGRWKIAPWVLVAGVMVGRVYVGAHNPLDVVCGAGLGLALAGIVNVLLPPDHPRRGRAGDEPAGAPATGRGDRRGGPADTRARLAAAALGVTLAATGCGAERADEPSTSLNDNVITVGSFDFAESVVLAEVYSQGLERHGYVVERAFDLGPREFVGPALDGGLIELVPEYAGTAAEFRTLGAASPTDDVATTHEELARALDGVPVVALAPAPAQDANTFVVTAATARRWDLESLSDLALVADQLVLGGPPECATRQLCMEGLADVYGARFREFVPLDAGGPLTRQGLLDGNVDVALMFTTDPYIEDLHLVELADDRGLQPAENITPVVRAELVERWGDDLVEAVDSVSALLTTDAVRQLNASASSGDVPAVAERWWAEIGS